MHLQRPASLLDILDIRSPHAVFRFAFQLFGESAGWNPILRRSWSRLYEELVDLFECETY